MKTKTAKEKDVITGARYDTKWRILKITTSQCDIPLSWHLPDLNSHETYGQFITDAINEKIKGSACESILQEERVKGQIEVLTKVVDNYQDGDSSRKGWNIIVDVSKMIERLQKQLTKKPNE